MDLKSRYIKLEHKNEFPTEGVKTLFYENFQSYESFYSEVYQQMFQCLFNYGMQICGNRELVKDCIQELFSEFWRNKKTLTKIKSIKPYLLKCLKRKIKRELGKGKRLFVAGSFEFEISKEVKIIGEEQSLRDQYLLNKALKSLTDRQREAVYLRFYGNLSYEEVAQILNINTKGLYKLVSRALTSLKTTMTTYC